MEIPPAETRPNMSSTYKISTPPVSRRRLMDEILPVETEMWRRGNQTRNGLKCSIGSPAPPDFNVDWQNIYHVDPPFRKDRFNIDTGGQGGMSVLDDRVVCARGF